MRCRLFLLPINIFSALIIQVANLKEKLTNELWLREALKSGLERSPGTLPKFPGYVPAKVRIFKFNYVIVLL